MWYALPFSRSCASNSARLQAGCCKSLRSMMRSQVDFHPVVRHLDAVASQLPMFGTVLVQDRIGVVDVNQHAARAGRQGVEVLDHPARAVLRQMADLVRALL